MSSKTSSKFEGSVEKIGTRVSVDILPNIPSSRQNFENFHPEKYPIKLVICFNIRAVDLKKDLKSTLYTIPKNLVKYRQTGKYSHCFNCYCQNVLSILPVLNDVLGKTEMYQRFLLREDQRVYPDDLWREGENILQNLKT